LVAQASFTRKLAVSQLLPSLESGSKI